MQNQLLREYFAQGRLANPFADDFKQVHCPASVSASDSKAWLQCIGFAKECPVPLRP